MKKIHVPRWIAETNKPELERRLANAGFDFGGVASIVEDGELVTYTQKERE